MFTPFSKVLVLGLALLVVACGIAQPLTAQPLTAIHVVDRFANADIGFTGVIFPLPDDPLGGDAKFHLIFKTTEQPSNAGHVIVCQTKELCAPIYQRFVDAGLITLLSPSGTVIVQLNATQQIKTYEAVVKALP